jgi:hypothetical protein
MRLVNDARIREVLSHIATPGNHSGTKSRTGKAGALRCYSFVHELHIVLRDRAGMSGSGR